MAVDERSCEALKVTLCERLTLSEWAWDWRWDSIVRVVVGSETLSFQEL